jgi:hypothetical protein
MAKRNEHMKKNSEHFHYMKLHTIKVTGQPLEYKVASFKTYRQKNNIENREIHHPRTQFLP